MTFTLYKCFKSRTEDYSVLYFCSITRKRYSCDHIEKCKHFKITVADTQEKLPTMYWIPKLHKTPYKARFIANSSSCTTTILSKLLTSCLTAVKEHIKRYCDKAYENSGINLYWAIKNSNEVLLKLIREPQNRSTWCNNPL